MKEDFLANPKVVELLQSLDLQAAIEQAAREKFGDIDGETHLFYAWRPLPKMLFQHHIMQCRAETIALCCANSCGKTMSGARLVAARMIGHEPLYGTMTKVPIKVWVVTKGSLAEGLFDELLAMIPPAEIDPREIKRATGRLRFKLRNGSVCEMKMFDQSVDAFKQAKCDLIWLDELPVDFETKWVEIHVRLMRRAGTLLITGTPDKYGHAWLKRKLVNLGWGQSEYLNAHTGKFAWFQADVRDNDKISADHLANLIKEIGPDEELFQIKIEGKWPDTEGSNIFPAWALNEQRKWVLPPERRIDFDDLGNPYERMNGAGFVVYEDPMPGYGYAIGVDLSEGGEKSDYSSVHVVKVLNNEVVATWHGRIDPIVLAKSVVALGHWYNGAVIAPEVNARCGQAFVGILREKNYPNIYRRPAPTTHAHLMQKTLGWETDPFNKPRICFETKRMLCDMKVVVHCPRTLDEMSNFQELRIDEAGANTMGFGAVEGNDDRVMSLMIALQATKQGHAYTRATVDEVFQYKDPRTAMAVAMVQGHLKEQRHGRRERPEEWW